MYSVKDREFVASEFSSEVTVSRISLRGQLVLNTLWFGLNAQSSALLPIVIPTQIVLFISSNQVGSAQQVLFLSWLMIAASIISLFMPPLIGTLSDRTPSNFGRRRPHIVIGGLLLVLSTPLLVNASSMVIFVVELAQYFLHAWTEPWGNHNFRMVFLARVSLILGLTLFMTFIEYYFARVQHIANFVLVTGIVAMLALGGAIVSGLVSGILSDRFKRRAPVVCGATLCMSLASLAFVIFPNNLITWLWLLGVLFGLGYGAYTSVNWALSIDVLPSLDKAGKDLGVWNASTTLPTIMAPLLGSVIINIAAGAGQTALGYRMVFGAAALFFFLAAAGILFVKK